MRLFKVKQNSDLVEYKEAEFKSEHQEQTLESWLENSPGSFIEDEKLMIIGRQVSTNLNSFIDLLALDRSGNAVIMELKRDRTPRETIAQALEYVSFVESLNYEELEGILRKYTGNEGENLSEYHRAFFLLDSNEAVSFNKIQRIAIIGSDITSPIQQTATFLCKKGIPITCAMFKYFQGESGEMLLSSEILVSPKKVGKLEDITTGTLPPIDKEGFLGSLDEAGRPFFEAILGLSEANGLPVHWGSKGFSLNVDINGRHVTLCFGYPPDSVFKQSLYTAFAFMKKQVENAEDLISSFREKFQQTGIFVPAGSELKTIIRHKMTEEKINEIMKILIDLANGLRALEPT